MSDTVTEIRPVAIAPQSGGGIAPINHGVINYYGSSGGGAAPSSSPVSVIPNFLIPAGIFVLAGALIFQVVVEGVNNWKTNQLTQQNLQLQQQLAAQTAQVEGAKQMLGCKP